MKIKSDLSNISPPPNPPFSKEHHVFFPPFSLGGDTRRIKFQLALLLFLFLGGGGSVYVCMYGAGGKERKGEDGVEWSGRGAGLVIYFNLKAMICLRRAW